MSYELGVSLESSKINLDEKYILAKRFDALNFIS